MDARLNGPAGPIFLTTTILTLGRGQDNQVVVNDPKASAHHAEIRPAVYGYTIVDLGSTNGTFVNEQRLEAHQPRTLNNADAIRIGDTRFTYIAQDAAETPATVYASPDLKPDENAYEPTVAAPPPAFNNYTPQPPRPPMPPDPQNYPGPLPAYMPPNAPFPAPRQQPRRSLRWLWITLGVVGGLALLLCVGLFFLVSALGASSPARTLDAFCTGINDRQYHDAYQQLSARVQSRESEQQFAQGFSSVNSCAHSTPTDDGSKGSANLTLTATGNLALNFKVNLIKDSNNTWKIDSLQQATQ